MDDLLQYIILFVMILVMYFIFSGKGERAEQLRKTVLPKSVYNMRMMGCNQELLRRIEILEDQYSKLIEKLDRLIDKLEGEESG